jgi:peptidoglycan/xylan/chitin deacetylase (PgdA/CDA1 family)
MNPESKKEEDIEIQSMVNNLSQDITRDLIKRKRNKKWIITTLLGIFGLGVISGVIYLLSLELNLKKANEVLAKQKSEIEGLEKTVNSYMYYEQIREEDYIRSRYRSIDAIPEKENLTDEVSQNLETLQAISKGFHGNNISRGNINFKEIALTFDLGTGEDLEFLKDTIDKYGIRITLFVSNERASSNSGSFFNSSNLQYIRKLSEMGKVVEFGNHTWSHYNFIRSLEETSPRKRKVFDYISDSILTPENIIEEMEYMEQKFFDVTGKELGKFYRLPYGSINRTTLNYLASLGYTEHVMWSYNQKGGLDLPDYVYKPFIYKIDPKTNRYALVKNPLYKSSEEVMDYLEQWEQSDENGMNGAILLMHLGSQRKQDKLITILPSFIQKMKKKGYRFVTLSECLNSVAD